MTSTGAGTDSHMGLFSVDTSTPPIITEGTYLRCNGTNLIWEDVTQSGITIVLQDSWNIDTFNGNGSYKFALRIYMDTILNFAKRN